MIQHIGEAEALRRLRLERRTMLGWLYSGKLRGRRRGGQWEVELLSLHRVEREIRGSQDEEA
jgi:hypothetical protein